MTWDGAQEVGTAQYAHFNQMERVEREREGTPMKAAESLRKSMRMQMPAFSRILGIKLATYKKKVAEGAALTGHYGYAVSEVERIVDQARDLLPADKQDFDVAKWFAEWITQPQPSLGGMKPEQLLDTPTGRKMVARVVGAMGSGAYL